MEPGAREEETIEDSESQILQPLAVVLDSASTSVIRPMKADLSIKDGYLLDASSKHNAIYSC
jgi:hypothetical protein